MTPIACASFVERLAFDDWTTISAVRFRGESAARTMLAAVAGTFNTRPGTSATTWTEGPETANVASFGGRFSDLSSRRTNASACLPPNEIDCEPPLGSRSRLASCQRPSVWLATPILSTTGADSALRTFATVAPSIAALTCGCCGDSASTSGARLKRANRSRRSSFAEARSIEIPARPATTAGLRPWSSIEALRGARPTSSTILSSVRSSAGPA